MRTKARHQRGMTLIEVLVAMVVLGTSAAALLTLLSIHTGNIRSLENRSLARIAAENAMVAVISADTDGERDENGGIVDVGGQTFEWSATRTAAPYAGLDIVTVSVAETVDGQVLASLTTLRLQ